VRRLPAEVLLLGAVLLWSFNFTTARYGVTHGFSPLVFASLRWGLAGLALIGVVWLRGQSLRVGRRDFRILGAIGVVGVLCSQVSFVYALRLSAASTVAIIFGTLPIVVSLISQASGIERLESRQWVASGISCAGVVLVAAGAGGTSTSSLWGSLLAVVSVASFAVYSVAIVPVMRRQTPLVATAVTTVVGAALLAIVAAALGEQDWDQPGGLAWGSLAYSAVPAVMIANVLWFTAVSRVGPGRASLYPNLQPFLGAVIALIVLNEGISPLEIVGGCVIAAGLVLGRRRSPPVLPVE
jgi:drug/metabolite transporter (DMT)-like permease